MLRPLLHFFLLGALAFAVVQVSGLNRVEFVAREGDAAQANEPVVVDEVRRAQLAADWRARFGTDPSKEDMQQLVAHALDEEILFREALRIGLDEIDPVTRQRLAQNMRFLSGEPSAPDTATPPAATLLSNEGAGRPSVDRANPVDDDDIWIARAHALDMHRSDLVVRRRLIQRMQAAIDALAPVPTRDEVRQFVESNPEFFLSAGRARVAYGFDTEMAARALPFRGTFDEDEIETLFGVEFITSLTTIVPGTITGPWPGPHGDAWVRVDEFFPPAPHPFDYVEDRAREMLAEAARARVRRERMRALRLRHGVAPDAHARGERQPSRMGVAG